MTLFINCNNLKVIYLTYYNEQQFWLWYHEIKLKLSISLCIDLSL